MQKQEGLSTIGWAFLLQFLSSMESSVGNPDLLLELLHYPMPYGKYKGQLIRQLPMYYLEWFAQKGFPAGKLGTLLQTMYEIKLNGLEYLLDGLKANQPTGTSGNRNR